MQLSRQARDIRGRKFGKLKVITAVDLGKDGSVIWLCRCECGNERKAIGCALKSGRIQACKNCTRLQRDGAWSARDEATLRKLYATHGLQELIQLLGRTGKAIKSRARVLGIHKAEGHGGKTHWTAERDAMLRRLYADNFAPAVARKMGITLSSVYNRAFNLGLEKSEAFRDMQSRLEGERLRTAGVAHRYPKGHVPKNKGLRRPGWAPGRMAATQFKKGIVPANVKPMWTFRFVDGYLMLKTGKQHKPPYTGWEYVHKLIWEQANGSLPDWRVARIWWKDGDHGNCSLSNLELVTSQEHMRRTTLWTVLPRPLAEVIQLAGALKRKIRNREEKLNGKKHDRRSAESPIRHTGSAAGHGEADGYRAS